MCDYVDAKAALKKEKTFMWPGPDKLRLPVSERITTRGLLVTRRRSSEHSECLGLGAGLLDVLALPRRDVRVFRAYFVGGAFRHAIETTLDGDEPVDIVRKMYTLKRWG